MRFTPHVREANSHRLEFSVFRSGLFLVQDATKMQYGKLKTSLVNDFKRFANCHVAAGKASGAPANPRLYYSVLVLQTSQDCMQKCHNAEHLT